MIELTKLNNDKFLINPHLMEMIEAAPHTIITMTNEKKYLVRETVEEIRQKVDEYYRRIHTL